MPYIITTTPGKAREAEIRHGARLTGIMDGSQPATPDSEAVTRDALAKLERMKSRRAVATLEEAREAVREIAWDKPHGQTPTPDDAMAIHTLPESGGTVGPLPDGTVIEVAPIAYSSLGGFAGLRASELPTDAEIIDAYNAREAS